MSNQGNQSVEQFEHSMDEALSDVISLSCQLSDIQEAWQDLYIEEDEDVDDKFYAFYQRTEALSKLLSIYEKDLQVAMKKLNKVKAYHSL
jgi:hypothetical protein